MRIASGIISLALGLLVFLLYVGIGGAALVKNQLHKVVV